jgi:hypothetical protein
MWCYINITIGLAPLFIGLYNGKLTQNVLLRALYIAVSLTGIRYAYIYQSKFIVPPEGDGTVF